MNRLYSLINLVNHLDENDTEIAKLLATRDDIYRKILRASGLVSTHSAPLSSFQTRFVREIANLVREENPQSIANTSVQEPTELW